MIVMEVVATIEAGMVVEAEMAAEADRVVLVNAESLLKNGTRLVDRAPLFFLSAAVLMQPIE